MGPALETFLGVLLLIGLLLAGAVWLTRPFWPRIANYFRRWHERDRLLEQQQRDEAACRRKAQQEVSAFCHDDIRQAQAAGGRQSDGGGVTEQRAGAIPAPIANAASERSCEPTGEPAQTQAPEQAQPIIQQVRQ